MVSLCSINNCSPPARRIFVISPLMQKFVQVIPLQPIRQTFTYTVPDDLASIAEVGARVLIPFGRKIITGVIAAFTEEKPEQRLKPLWDVLDPEPIWTKEYLDFTKWVADYYFAPWGEVLHAALPQGMTSESDFRIVPLVDDLAERAAQIAGARAVKRIELLRLVGKYPEGISIKTLRNKLQYGGISAAIKEYEQQGLIAVQATDAEQKAKPKFVRYLRAADILLNSPDAAREALEELGKRSPKQAAVLTFLLDHYQKANSGLPSAELISQTKASASSINGLVERGYIITYEKEIKRSFFTNYSEPPKPTIFTLNDRQLSAIDSISSPIQANIFQTFLLHGVTGSGKTQVYIEVIKKTLEQKRAVITLVPEISLTPQLIDRYRAYFGNEVAVLHSKMSIGERYDTWRDVQSGKCNVIIGARSALFAPVKNLGLIVVDEEHEASFKQNDTAPRYNARDCAIVRASMQKAVVVLGSATPSLESYHNVTTGKYTLLELPDRVDNALMPDILVVDTREARKKKTIHNNISFTLRDHIQLRLQRKEGIILLQNRRGFAPIQQCLDCGASPQCPHCSVTLTYHKVRNQLRCHYCGHTIPAVTACMTCGSTNVKLFGAGTQRVEEDIAVLFPQAKIVRMDLDTTARKGSHKEILDAFGSGEADILLGTQMVAKGLDFPRVTLVGVINADTQLHLPDFRASERTFQLLTQVSGRAGRTAAQKGEVIIQTSNPLDDAIKATVDHNYKGFYEHELQKRKEIFYPPFSRIILIELKGKDDKLVQQHAHLLRQLIAPADFFEVLGPQQAPIPKLRDEYRWRIIIKNDKDKDIGGARLRVVLQHAMDEYTAKHTTRAVKVILDVDPQGV